MPPSFGRIGQLCGRSLGDGTPRITWAGAFLTRWSRDSTLVAWRGVRASEELGSKPMKPGNISAMVASKLIRYLGAWRCASRMISTNNSGFRLIAATTAVSNCRLAARRRSSITSLSAASWRRPCSAARAILLVSCGLLLLFLRHRAQQKVP